MNAKTYESVQGIGKTGQTLESFGEAQNQLNAEMLKELRVIQLQTNMLLRQMLEAQTVITKLKEEQVKYILKLSKCEAELESLRQNAAKLSRYEAEIENLHQEVDRLKLTARLNTNAIDRMTRKANEADES